MNWVDILVLIILLIITVLLTIYFVNKKKKGHSILSDCDTCSSKNNLVKQYNRKYKKRKSLK